MNSHVKKKAVMEAKAALFELNSSVLLYRVVNVEGALLLTK